MGYLGYIIFKIIMYYKIYITIKVGRKAFVTNYKKKM